MGSVNLGSPPHPHRAVVRKMGLPKSAFGILLERPPPDIHRLVVSGQERLRCDPRRKSEDLEPDGWYPEILP
jgi:hypothetical protein